MATNNNIRARYDSAVKDLKVIEDTGECQYVYLYVRVFALLVFLYVTLRVKNQQFRTNNGYSSISLVGLKGIIQKLEYWFS